MYSDLFDGRSLVPDQRLVDTGAVDVAPVPPQHGRTLLNVQHPAILRQTLRCSSRHAVAPPRPPTGG